MHRSGRDGNHKEARNYISFTKTRQRPIVNRKLASHHPPYHWLQDFGFNLCRVKTGLDSIIAETQTGFMRNRHISCNIRLILDLLDYAEAIKSEALILFLIFTKPLKQLNTFLLQSIKKLLVLVLILSTLLTCFTRTTAQL